MSMKKEKSNAGKSANPENNGKLWSAFLQEMETMDSLLEIRGGQQNIQEYCGLGCYSGSSGSSGSGDDQTKYCGLGCYTGSI